jgi:hypothetical protein
MRLIRREVLGKIAQSTVKKERVMEASVMVDINSRKGPSERCVGWLFVDVDR